MGLMVSEVCVCGSGPVTEGTNQPVHSLRSVSESEGNRRRGTLPSNQVLPKSNNLGFYHFILIIPFLSCLCHT